MFYLFVSKSGSSASDTAGYARLKSFAPSFLLAQKYANVPIRFLTDERDVVAEISEWMTRKGLGAMVKFDEVHSVEMEVERELLRLVGVSVLEMESGGFKSVQDHVIALADEDFDELEEMLRVCSKADNPLLRKIEAEKFAEIGAMYRADLLKEKDECGEVRTFNLIWRYLGAREEAMAKAVVDLVLKEVYKNGYGEYYCRMMEFGDEKAEESPSETSAVIESESASEEEPLQIPILNESTALLDNLANDLGLALSETERLRLKMENRVLKTDKRDAKSDDENSENGNEKATSPPNIPGRLSEISDLVPERSDSNPERSGNNLFYDKLSTELSQAITPSCKSDLKIPQPKHNFLHQSCCERRAERKEAAERREAEKKRRQAAKREAENRSRRPSLIELADGVPPAD